MWADDIFYVATIKLVSQGQSRGSLAIPLLAGKTTKKSSNPLHETVALNLGPKLDTFVQKNNSDRSSEFGMKKLTIISIKLRKKPVTLDRGDEQVRLIASITSI